MQKSVIITAGGIGKRMKSNIPKQFMLLACKPIIMHSIEAFISYDSKINIFVVLPELFFDSWHKLQIKYNFKIKHTLIAGGKERYHSIKNALNQIKSDGIIAIHDAVRPLVSKKIISECFKQAEKYGSAVPVIPLNESIRYIKNSKNYSVDRSNYMIVQTPQLFLTDILKKAYKQPYKKFFYDDASLVEAAGYKIFFTEGQSKNIKITYPFDIKTAEFYLKTSDF